MKDKKIADTENAERAFNFFEKSRLAKMQLVVKNLLQMKKALSNKQSIHQSMVTLSLSHHERALRS